MEIDLIDKICDYIKSEMFIRNHHWFNDYIFSFTTNGLNYNSNKIQNYIAKNKDHLSITITIDITIKTEIIDLITRPIIYFFISYPFYE